MHQSSGQCVGAVHNHKNFLVTQRVVFQPRLETHAAVQRVERFTTGRGLNNIELGFRLRYEIRREFAPYLGVSFDRSFFGTADLVRQEGETLAKFDLSRACGCGSNLSERVCLTSPS
ncbi:MAG: copper resistance protein B (plasmid) [Candidatus Manganitrophus sp.]|nr:MAG: copper resistance protein B [Candidatus Manganitrophus sp.]